MSINRKVFILYTSDFALIAISFFLFIWIKPVPFFINLHHYFQPFFVFFGIWFFASIYSKKYSVSGKSNIRDFLNPVIISSLISLGAVTFLMVFFNRFSYSRIVVFGTIGFSGFLELILFSLYYYYRKLNRGSEKTETVQAYLDHLEKLSSGEIPMPLPEPKNEGHYPIFSLLFHRGQILDETGEEVYNFISKHLDDANSRSVVLATTTRFNVEAVPPYVCNVLVNLKPINDIRRVSKFFKMANTKLPVGGLFIDCVITNEIRKQRILKRNPPGINYFIYFFYYIFKRVFPKIAILKKIYFFLTNGYERAMSKAEAFGRLYSCGFEVLADQEIDENLFFVARKIADPPDDDSASYGPLISLKRMGKNGKIIYVYKFRTMHPYSEYIQHYVFAKNDLKKGGKFKDDFRISTTGRIMRRLWIDELPMLFNLFIGDLKLVGVRPLSIHYFNLFSKELQERRSKHRPGLIPPFYADMPETFEEIMASEMRYLEAYEKRPFLTDFNYLRKALFNIIFRGKRSG